MLGLLYSGTYDALTSRSSAPKPASESPLYNPRARSAVTNPIGVVSRVYVICCAPRVFGTTLSTSGSDELRPFARMQNEKCTVPRDLLRTCLRLPTAST